MSKDVGHNIQTILSIWFLCVMHMFVWVRTKYKTENSNVNSIFLFLLFYFICYFLFIISLLLFFRYFLNKLEYCYPINNFS